MSKDVQITRNVGESEVTEAKDWKRGRVSGPGT